MTSTTPQTPWEGAPAGAGSGRWFDWILSAFALLLMIVALAFCTITIWTGSPVLVTAYGVLVFCFGAWFLAGRRLRRRRRRRSSRYRIADGMLTVTIGSTDKVIPLAQLTGVRYEEHGDGTATVWACIGEGPAEPLLEAVREGVTALDCLGYAVETPPVEQPETG